MKLGVYDSGIGGLLIARAIRRAIPDIDMLYFGDTLHIPYGNKSSETIYTYSERAVDFLFRQECKLVLTACNTVSATALRRLQQHYLPHSPYQDRRILGVVVPTLETAIDQGHTRLGVIATNYTIQSNIYPDELKKIRPEIDIIQKQTPLLVPMIENEGMPWIEPVLRHYLAPLQSHNIECLLLGCTHYPFLKSLLYKILGHGVSLLSQDDIIPDKLVDYLMRHPEISEPILRNAVTRFLVSDITDGYQRAAREIYGGDIHLEHATFNAIENTYTIKEP